MSRVNILVKFNIHSLEDDYYIIGQSNTGSFTHRIGSAFHPDGQRDLFYGNVADFKEGDSAEVSKVVALGEKYGDYRIRMYAENELGIRSPYVELDKIIPAPDVSGTFRFRSVNVRRLEQEKPGAVRSVRQVPTEDNNVMSVYSEFIGMSPVIDWELQAPRGYAGNAKGGIVGRSNVDLFSSLFKNFDIQFYTDNGYVNEVVDEKIVGYEDFSLVLTKGVISRIMGGESRKLYVKVTGYDVFYNAAATDAADHMFEAKIELDNIRSDLNTAYAELYGNQVDVSYANRDPDFLDGYVKVIVLESSKENDPNYPYEKVEEQSLTGPTGDYKYDQSWSKDNHYYKYVLELNDAYGFCCFYSLSESGGVSARSRVALIGESVAGDLHADKNAALDAAIASSDPFEAFIKIKSVNVRENGADFEISWRLVDSMNNIVHVENSRSGTGGSVSFSMSGIEGLQTDFQGFTAYFSCPDDYIQSSVVMPKRDAFNLDILGSEGAPTEHSNGPTETIDQDLGAPQTDDGFSITGDTQIYLSRSDNALLYQSWLNEHNRTSWQTSAGAADAPIALVYKSQTARIEGTLPDYRGAEIVDEQYDGFQYVDAQRKIQITVSLVDNKGQDVDSFTRVAYNAPPALVQTSSSNGRKTSFAVAPNPKKVNFTFPVSEKIESIKVFRRPYWKYDDTDQPIGNKFYGPGGARNIDNRTKSGQLSVYNKKHLGAYFGEHTPTAPATPEQMLYGFGIDDQQYVKRDSLNEYISNDEYVDMTTEEQELYRRFEVNGRDLEDPSFGGFYAGTIVAGPNTQGGDSVNFNINGLSINQDEVFEFEDHPPMLRRRGLAVPGETQYEYLLVPYDSFGSGVYQDLGFPITVNTQKDVGEDEHGGMRLQDFDAPGPPTNVQIVGSIDTFFLEWDRPSDSVAGDLSHYNLIYIIDSRDIGERQGFGDEDDRISVQSVLRLNDGNYDYNSSEFHAKDLAFKVVDDGSTVDALLWDERGKADPNGGFVSYQKLDFVKCRPGNDSRLAYNLYKYNGDDASGTKVPGDHEDWEEQENVTLFNGGEFIYSENIVHTVRDDLLKEDGSGGSSTYHLIFWQASKTYNNKDIVFHRSSNEDFARCYRSTQNALTGTAPGGTGWKEIEGVILREIEISSSETSLMVPSRANDAGYFFFESVDRTGNRSVLHVDPGSAEDPANDYFHQLGKAQLRDIEDLEQGLSEEFPGTVMLRPNDPFSITNNDTLSWHAHYLYFNGDAHFMPAGSISLKDVSLVPNKLEGTGTSVNVNEFVRYVYWNPLYGYDAANRKFKKREEYSMSIRDNQLPYRRKRSVVDLDQGSSVFAPKRISLAKFTELGGDSVYVATDDTDASKPRELTGTQYDALSEDDKNTYYLFQAIDYELVSEQKYQHKTITDENDPNFTITQTEFDQMGATEQENYFLVDLSNDEVDEGSGLLEKEKDTDIDFKAYYSFSSGNPASQIFNLREDDNSWVAKRDPLDPYIDQDGQQMWKHRDLANLINQDNYNELDDSSKANYFAATDLERIIDELNKEDKEFIHQIPTYEEVGGIQDNDGKGYFGLHIHRDAETTTNSVCSMPSSVCKIGEIIDRQHTTKSACEGAGGNWTSVGPYFEEESCEANGGDWTETKSIIQNGGFQIARIDNVDGEYSVKHNFVVFNVATIGQANIANATITTAQIADVAATKITAGKIGAHKIEIGGGIMPTVDSSGKIIDAQPGYDNPLLGPGPLLDNSLETAIPFTSVYPPYVLYSDAGNAQQIWQHNGLDEGDPQFRVNQDQYNLMGDDIQANYFEVEYHPERDDAQDYNFGAITSEGFGHLTRGTPGFFISGDGQFGFQTNTGGLYLRGGKHGTAAENSPTRLVLRGSLIQESSDPFIKMELSATTRTITFDEHAENHFYYQDDTGDYVDPQGQAYSIYGSETIVVRPSSGAVTVSFNISNAFHVDGEPYAAHNVGFRAWVDGDKTKKIAADDLAECMPNGIRWNNINDINKGGDVTLDFLTNSAPKQLIRFTGAPIVDASSDAASDPPDPFDVIKDQLVEDDLINESEVDKVNGTIIPIADSVTFEMYITAQLDLYTPSKTYLVGDLVKYRKVIEAKDMQSGIEYTIIALGNTDFTAVGADAGDGIGDSFTATGAGSGTGTVASEGFRSYRAKQIVPRGDFSPENEKSFPEYENAYWLFADDTDQQSEVMLESKTLTFDRKDQPANLVSLDLVAEGESVLKNNNGTVILNPILTHGEVTYNLKTYQSGWPDWIKTIRSQLAIYQKPVVPVDSGDDEAVDSIKYKRISTANQSHKVNDDSQSANDNFCVVATDGSILNGKGDYVLLDWRPGSSAVESKAWKKYITKTEKETNNEVAAASILDVTDGVPQAIIEVEEKDKFVTREFYGQRVNSSESYKLEKFEDKDVAAKVIVFTPDNRTVTKDIIVRINSGLGNYITRRNIELFYLDGGSEVKACSFVDDPDNAGDDKPDMVVFDMDGDGVYNTRGVERPNGKARIYFSVDSKEHVSDISLHAEYIYTKNTTQHISSDGTLVHLVPGTAHSVNWGDWNDDSQLFTYSSHFDTHYVSVTNNVSTAISSGADKRTIQKIHGTENVLINTTIAADPSFRMTLSKPLISYHVHQSEQRVDSLLQRAENIIPIQLFMGKDNVTKEVEDQNMVDSNGNALAEFGVTLIPDLGSVVSVSYLNAITSANEPSAPGSDVGIAFESIGNDNQAFNAIKNILRQEYDAGKEHGEAVYYDNGWKMRIAEEGSNLNQYQDISITADEVKGNYLFFIPPALEDIRAFGDTSKLKISATYKRNAIAYAKKALEDTNAPGYDQGFHSREFTDEESVKIVRLEDGQGEVFLALDNERTELAVSDGGEMVRSVSSEAMQSTIEAYAGEDKLLVVSEDFQLVFFTANYQRYYSPEIGNDGELYFYNNATGSELLVGDGDSFGYRVKIPGGGWSAVTNFQKYDTSGNLQNLQAIVDSGDLALGRKIALPVNDEHNTRVDGNDNLGLVLNDDNGERVGEVELPSLMRNGIALMHKKGFHDENGDVQNPYSWKFIPDGLTNANARGTGTNNASKLNHQVIMNENLEMVSQVGYQSPQSPGVTTSHVVKLLVGDTIMVYGSSGNDVTARPLFGSQSSSDSVASAAEFNVKLYADVFLNSKMWQSSVRAETRRDFVATIVGKPGATVVYRAGGWTPSKTYMGTPFRREIVLHGGQYYITKESASAVAWGDEETAKAQNWLFDADTLNAWGGDPRQTAVGKPAAERFDPTFGAIDEFNLYPVWEEFGATLEAVATNVLLAQDIFVQKGIVAGIEDVTQGFFASQIDPTFLDSAGNYKFVDSVRGETSQPMWLETSSSVESVFTQWEYQRVENNNHDLDPPDTNEIGFRYTADAFFIAAASGDIAPSDYRAQPTSSEPPASSDANSLEVVSLKTSPYAASRLPAVTTWKLPFTEVPGFYLGYHKLRYGPDTINWDPQGKAFQHESLKTKRAIFTEHLPMLEMRSHTGNFFRWDGLRMEMYGSVMNGSVNPHDLSIRLSDDNAVRVFAGDGPASSNKHYGGQIFCGGGFGNYIPDNLRSLGSVIGGGGHNKMNAQLSVIAGGYGNVCNNNFSFIGSGFTNYIGLHNQIAFDEKGDIRYVGKEGSSSRYAQSDRSPVDVGNSFNTIVTGKANKIIKSAFSFIGTGFNNYIENSAFASILNGQSNVITSVGSLDILANDLTPSMTNASGVDVEENKSYANYPSSDKADIDFEAYVKQNSSVYSLWTNNDSYTWSGNAQGGSGTATTQYDVTGRKVSMFEFGIDHQHNNQTSGNVLPKLAEPADTALFGGISGDNPFSRLSIFNSLSEENDLNPDSYRSRKIYRINGVKFKLASSAWTNDDFVTSDAMLVVPQNRDMGVSSGFTSENPAGPFYFLTSEYAYNQNDQKVDGLRGTWIYIDPRALPFVFIYHTYQDFSPGYTSGNLTGWDTANGSATDYFVSNGNNKLVANGNYGGFWFHLKLGKDNAIAFAGYHDMIGSSDPGSDMKEIDYGYFAIDMNHIDHMSQFFVFTNGVSPDDNPQGKSNQLSAGGIYEYARNAPINTTKTNQNGTPTPNTDTFHNGKLPDPQILDFLDTSALPVLQQSSGVVADFPYNTIAGGRGNILNQTVNCAVIGSSDSYVSNLRSTVIGGMLNRAFGAPKDRQDELRINKMVQKGLTIMGSENLYDVRVANWAYENLKSSIVGSENTIIGCRRTVVVGSNNQFKGARFKPNSFKSTDPYFKITGTEVNIFGTNNSIEVESAAARNLSIFGSNFTLSTQEQLVNAYYIGNPFPAGGLLSRLFVAADGGSYFTGDVISFALSDIKYKENIVEIDSALDKVLKIRGVTFDWKTNQDIYEGRDVGVIAQEVEEILPEVVEDRKTGKAVKYEKLTPLLIEAIKDQNKIIEILKKQIEDLTLAVNKLQ